MKKGICMFICMLMSCLLVLPVMAASEAPAITLQPQSAFFQSTETATYTVKAEGTNLSATWYMTWNGKTYTISDTGGAMQDWEPYAGENYGANKLDDNTFMFRFVGIESELNGGEIWCVIEDGHNDVTSQKARIMVGSESEPPEMISIPAEITVEQGKEAEIRCVAKSPNDSQLSYLWYETDTGKLEDIRAVNRGTETADYLLCDTSALGTRYYVCMVQTSEGGTLYSSIVSVTVTEKQPEPTEPQPTEPQPTEPQPTTGSTDPETPPTQAPTEAPGDTDNEDVKTDNAEKDEEKDDVKTDGAQNGTPWWVIAIIAVAAAGIGFGIAAVVFKKKA